ncbi:MAG: hypothetical protein DI578_03960 [Ectopseudomonas oleovorans]|nr:MAG: hypothetical protein DI578_03960 [Pseudomonas oleovorans]
MAWPSKPRNATGDGLLRVGPAALKTGSKCSCTKVHSAFSPVFALQDSSSQDLHIRRLCLAGR